MHPFVNEADAVVLESLIVTDGFIDVTAGGDITATYVRTLTDGADKDITLKSTGDIFADDIEAGADAGSDKTAGEVTLWGGPLRRPPLSPTSESQHRATRKRGFTRYGYRG